MNKVKKQCLTININKKEKSIINKQLKFKLLEKESKKEKEKLMRNGGRLGRLTTGSWEEKAALNCDGPVESSGCSDGVCGSVGPVPGCRLDMINKYG